jgi:peptidoglycan hydrolase-like protein with peptidoglycan-binding domain
MIFKKDFYRNVFVVVAALFVLAAARVESYASDSVPIQGRTELGEQGSGADSNKAASSLWRSYIWENFPDDVLKGSEPDPVSEAYQQNDWKPIFISGQFHLSREGKLFWECLHSLEDQAIDSTPYKLDELARSIESLEHDLMALKGIDPDPRDTTAEALANPIDTSAASHTGSKPGMDGAPASPPPVSPQERLEKYHQTFQAAGELDVRLVSAFVRYAKEMNPFCGADLTEALAGRTPIPRFLKDLEPASGDYENLVSTYIRYKKLSAGGRQTYVASAPLRPGESGNNIRDLQKRLQQEDFYSGTITGIYDSETQHAVKQFQIAHQIDPDGAVGQRTRDWLNVSFREKAEMVAYSMKGMRQSKTRTANRFIRINIPQFLLEYYKDGNIQETHRIVVGKAGGKRVKFRGRMVGENQTPTLTSSIEQIILNPRWYVSDRIRLELDSEAKSDPSYFTRHGYVQMSSLHAWGEPRIFQMPGPKNALGRVKFEFPNVYAVYLHDTPLKQLFQRSRRDFSHGCIRVDKAINLAETLLKDDNSTYVQKINSIVETDHQVFVKLAQPVPISIEYLPVFPNGKGQVVFLGDPYGLLTDTVNRKG